MDTWFTSDTHFGHARIAEFCPTRVTEFGMSGSDDIQTMNEAMVDQWNSQVAPGDKVYHLGDLAMGKIADSLSYVGQLNGQIELIWGNHDRPHPIYSRTPEKRLRWVQEYGNAGVHIQRMSNTYTFGDIDTLLWHFPYTGDTEGEDRYTAHRPEDRGMVLVHGHIHDMWQVNGRQVNVGLDAHGGRLLHEDEVRVMVEEASAN